MKKSYTLGLYEKAMPGTLSWREKLEAARDADFDFVEISIDETDQKLARLDMSAEERLELVRLMAETGVPIRTMCLSGHRKYPLGSSDPETCRRGMEIMEKAIRLAEDLGIRIIQLAGYDVYYDPSTPETVERSGKNLEKAVHMAAKAGVTMGFETMETEFMNTVEKAMNARTGQLILVVSAAFWVDVDMRIILSFFSGCCKRGPEVLRQKRCVWPKNDRFRSFTGIV